MKRLILVVTLLTLISCQTISPYSSTAYMQAVELKVKSLELMGKATDSYNSHVKEIFLLNRELNVAYEFAKGRKKNRVSTKQWEILINPNRNLLGGFLRFWQKKDKMSLTFIFESKRLVSDAFDTIIGLESGKLRLKDINQ